MNNIFEKVIKKMADLESRVQSLEEYLAQEETENNLMYTHFTGMLDAPTDDEGDDE